jgi:hypothetical protein
MAESAREGEYMLDRPNRDKASSKTTRAIVVLILLVSVVLMTIVTIGGWTKLQGAKPIQIAYILIYLIMAFYVTRWNRGVLPMAAALAIVLGIFAAVAAPVWFDRDRFGGGFGHPGSAFGGDGLSESMLGLLTFVIVPVQILLVAFSMQGFRQAWNVEVEVPAEKAGPHATPIAA